MPPQNNPPLDPTRFILIGTSHRGNVGAAARAMKVMGFHDLVLVAPRFDDALTHDDAIAMASGATDVLARARVVPTLTQALDGVTHLCATAMTPRDFGPPTVAPREHFEALQRTVFDPTTQTAGGAQHRVAFAFGSERFGMLNDDVYQCHACLSIPTDPSYGSLNLAQAVQLIAYEWRQACGGFPVQPRTAPTPLADGAAIAGALAHWQSALVHTTYLDPDVPKRLMSRLQQLALRAALTDDEVHILRGVARAVLAMKRP
jgi:tRNA/rRNA methyltransferase